MIAIISSIISAVSSIATTVGPALSRDSQEMLKFFQQIDC